MATFHETPGYATEEQSEINIDLGAVPARLRFVGAWMDGEFLLTWKIIDHVCSVTVTEEEENSWRVEAVVSRT